MPRDIVMPKERLDAYRKLRGTWNQFGCETRREFNAMQISDGVLAVWIDRVNRPVRPKGYGSVVCEYCGVSQQRKPKCLQCGAPLG